MGKVWIIALAAVGAAGVETESTFNAFISFVGTYGRSYARKQHLGERYGIFKENLTKIEKHNSSDALFRMAVNQFSDFREPEFL